MGSSGRDQASAAASTLRVEGAIRLSRLATRVCPALVSVLAARVVETWASEPPPSAVVESGRPRIRVTTDELDADVLQLACEPVSCRPYSYGGARFPIIRCSMASAISAIPPGTTTVRWAALDFGGSAVHGGAFGVDWVVAQHGGDPVVSVPDRWLRTVHRVGVTTRGGWPLSDGDDRERLAATGRLEPLNRLAPTASAVDTEGADGSSQRKRARRHVRLPGGAADLTAPPVHPSVTDWLGDGEMGSARGSAGALPVLGRAVFIVRRRAGSRARARSRRGRIG